MKEQKLVLKNIDSFKLEDIFENHISTESTKDYRNKEKENEKTNICL